MCFKRRFKSLRSNCLGTGTKNKKMPWGQGSTYLNFPLVKRKFLRNFMLLGSNCNKMFLFTWFKGLEATPHWQMKLAMLICMVLDLKDGRCHCEGLVDSFSAIFNCCWGQEASASGVCIEGLKEARCPKRQHKKAGKRTLNFMTTKRCWW